MKLILDLTKPLSDSIEVYAEGSYRDPEFSCIEWSSFEQQGYRVSALTIGTQTGTHIDAPNHFDADGNCLEALPLEHLMGRYFLLDLAKEVSEHSIKTQCASYNNESILFVRSDNSGTSSMTRQSLDILLELPALVLVLDGEISVKEAAPLEFHRLVARRGKYLIENLHSEIARRVKPGGQLIALPLALVGTSGAPCRVVVTQGF